MDEQLTQEGTPKELEGYTLISNVKDLKLFKNDILKVKRLPYPFQFTPNYPYHEGYCYIKSFIPAHKSQQGYESISSLFICNDYAVERVHWWDEQISSHLTYVRLTTLEEKQNLISIIGTGIYDDIVVSALDRDIRREYPLCI